MKIKRIPALIMTGALVASLCAQAVPQASQAAGRTKLATKKIKVTVGKKKKIKIKNKKKGIKYSFKSNKRKVASVSKKGVVKGKKKGRAKITVKKGKKKLGIVRVIVKAKRKTTTDVATQTAAASETAAASVSPQTTTGTNAPSASPLASTGTNAPSALPQATSGNEAPSALPQTTTGTEDSTPSPQSATETEAPVSPTGTNTTVPDITSTPEASTEAPVKTEEPKESSEPEASDVPSEETPDPDSKVIYSLDFEDCETEPFSGRGCSINIGDVGHDSEHSLYSGVRTADWHGISLNLSDVAEVGKKYQIHMFVMPDSDEDMIISGGLQYIPEGETSTKYDFITGSAATSEILCKAGEWTELSFFTEAIEPNTGTVSIYWQSVYGTDDFRSFYIDDFTISGVAKEQEEVDYPDLSGGLEKTKAGNPALNLRLTADPWAMEYDGRVYVYGTNDSQQYDKAPTADNDYSKINTLNCYSTADMVNWTYHGEIPVAGKKGAATWASNSWAPAAAHKTIDGKEKFFLYFADNGSGIGVLTADSPTGPWTDPLGKQLISRKTPNCSSEEVPWLFDPAVLVDDDGTGYLYFGGIGDAEDRVHPNCIRAVKLGDDMISLADDPVTIDAPYAFEDSGINKIGDKYYYSYCTNWDSLSGRDAAGAPTANIAVMESDNPLTGFKFVGSVLRNPGSYFGSYGNNHHCFLEFKGQYYAFYHTKADTIALGCKTDYRTTYVDYLNLGDNGDFTNEDGSVARTVMTKAGVDPLDGVNINPYENVESETFSMSGGVKAVANTEEESSVDLWAGSNYSMQPLTDTSFLGVSNVDFGTDGAKKISIVFSSDAENPAYQTAESEIDISCTGVHDVIFKFTENGKLRIYLDEESTETLLASFDDVALIDKWICE